MVLVLISKAVLMLVIFALSPFFGLPKISIALNLWKHHNHRVDSAGGCRSMTQQTTFSKLIIKPKHSNFMKLAFLVGVLYLTALVLDMKQVTERAGKSFPISFAHYLVIINCQTESVLFHLHQITSRSLWERKTKHHHSTDSSLINLLQNSAKTGRNGITTSHPLKNFYTPWFSFIFTY